MTIVKLTTEEMKTVLTTNLQDWKLLVDVLAVCNLNWELTPDDIETIIHPDFYDAIHDDSIVLETLLDNTWINPDLAAYGRSAFITIHDVYNR
ncbi:hypothetical protein nepoznato_138 [Escherichia phage nepoznato]|uniref:Uncharacterized protein n=1 Tax=Escherichia phage nepoznato TaxID=2696431 RepID=A0A6B9WJ88_9CAUD|nr:hypothetical protein JR323_gp139 [Escherichia phage nepoznato]QHR65587.1 hypothetical protein nepoznato_138 [Escherichia phage nepoznato]